MKTAIRTGISIFITILMMPAGNLAEAGDVKKADRYRELVRIVEMSKQGLLKTSYRTGPELNSRTEVCFKKEKTGPLVVTVRMPRQVIPKRDERTGKIIRSVFFPTLFMRDHDLDGLPDDYKIEPKGKIRYAEKHEWTPDGYVRIADPDRDLPVMRRWKHTIDFAVRLFVPAEADAAGESGKAGK